MSQQYGIDEGCSRVVLHFLRTVNETTGGYREFAVWREKNMQHEKNIVFVCGKKTEGNKNNCCEVKVIWGNGEIKKIRERIKEILTVCRKKEIPVIFHIQQFSAIDTVIKSTAGLGIRKHMVYTMKSTFSGYADKCIRRQCILSALWAKHLTFLSYASYADYPAVIKWMKGKNISVIEHGADRTAIQKTDFEVRKGEPRQIFEFIYTARIVPVKNHIFLLDVMENVEGIHITLVGEENGSAIQREIKKRHLDSKISITGLMSREKVYSLLVNADGYLSPSTVEGMPVSVLEAMHAGLPMILSDIEPHMELAKKTDGIIILPLKTEMWVEKLKAFKNMKTEELSRLGDENWNAANRYFTLERMHRRYGRLYSSLE